MSDFRIDHLDHVAIRVKDMELSVKWYVEVLGLKPYRPEAWGPFPIFMLAGETGVALFPVKNDSHSDEQILSGVRIDHFAFRVSNSDFQKAQKKFRSMKIDFDFQDHTYFHSIYLSDPDGHKVELTTIMVDPSEFY